ncbi:MAG: hypothetical protein GY861_17600 [bacterium]|nr:hypothetical protein [bacterium]
MAQYNNGIASFGGVYFNIGTINASEQPSTLKTTLGKLLIEKQIPLRDTKDTKLSVSGIITGLSRTSGQTIAAAIEVDRLALIALDDGAAHAYDDGKHTGMNFAIITGSLRWPDDASRSPGQPNKFTMEIIEWQ